MGILEKDILHIIQGLGFRVWMGLGIRVEGYIGVYGGIMGHPN